MAPRAPLRPPRAPQEGPKKRLGIRNPSFLIDLLQDGPKRRPGGPKRPPRWPQEASKRPQEAAMRPQEAPKRPQEASKRPPRAPQEDPKRPQEAPPKHPRRPRAPIDRQETPKTPEEASKRLPRGIREAFNHPPSVIILLIPPSLGSAVPLFAPTLPWSPQLAWASFLDGLVGIREASRICGGCLERNGQYGRVLEASWHRLRPP